MCLNTFEKHLKSRFKKCQRLVTLNALLISNKPFIIAVAAFDKKPTDMTLITEELDTSASLFRSAVHN